MIFTPYQSFREGPGLRLVIQFDECDLKCFGCHMFQKGNLNLYEQIEIMNGFKFQYNKDLNKKEQFLIQLLLEKKYKEFRIINNSLKLQKKGIKIEGLTISGGNPLQSFNIEMTKEIIKKTKYEDILIYTGKEKINENMFEKPVKYKIGPFNIKKMNQMLQYYGSENQKFNFKHQYKKIEKIEEKTIDFLYNEYKKIKSNDIFKDIIFLEKQIDIWRFL